MRVKCLWDGACVALGKSTLGVKHSGKKTHKKSLYIIHEKNYEYISSGFYSIIFSIYELKGTFCILSLNLIIVAQVSWKFTNMFLMQDDINCHGNERVYFFL